MGGIAVSFIAPRALERKGPLRRTPDSRGLVGRRHPKTGSALVPGGSRAARGAVKISTAAWPSSAGSGETAHEPGCCSSHPRRIFPVRRILYVNPAELESQLGPDPKTSRPDATIVSDCAERPILPHPHPAPLAPVSEQRFAFGTTLDPSTPPRTPVASQTPWALEKRLVSISGGVGGGLDKDAARQDGGLHQTLLGLPLPCFW